MNAPRLHRCALLSGLAILLITGSINSQIPKPAPTKGKGFPVSTLAIDGVVQKKVNLFDLEGKTLRFTPQKDAAYKVEVIAEATLIEAETPLVNPGAVNVFGLHAWPVTLPFEFPFGGKNWDKVHINNNGHLSFDKPESVHWPLRYGWPDAGMLSTAAAIDSRSMAGLEKMIAVLWAPYEIRHTRVFTKIEKDRFIVTWQAKRLPWAHAVAGEVVFQARLLRSGVIEMAYSRVPERDGIVGLFTGQALKEERLHRWENKEKAPHPSVDIVSGTLDDLGSVIRGTLLMKEDVQTKVEGRFDYRMFIKYAEQAQQFCVSVTDSARSDCGVDAAPRIIAFRAEGKTVEFYYSKVLLNGVRKFNVEWDAVWWGHPGRYLNSLNQLLPVELKRNGGEVDLSSGTQTLSGNLFEVFHYPQVTRNSQTLLRHVYNKYPPRDDIALVFTDFRIDDLFATGAGANPINHAIKGIGKSAETPASTENIGSKRLQMSISNIWIGSPNFAESGLDGDAEWINFGRAVGWLAHECTHRWGMDISFRDPKTNKDERLTDDVFHWREGLNTLAHIPVADHYTGRATLGHSIMSGNAWRENPDGTFSKSPHPYVIPGGYSALDLYVMGLLPPDQVPDTFLIRDLKDLGGNRYEGKKVVVRIEDVIKAMGKREPDSARAQKEYRLAIYLVHESGREVNPAMLTRAKKLGAALADFFERATGNRMKIVVSQKE